MYQITEEQFGELRAIKARLDNFLMPDRTTRILATDSLGELLEAIGGQLAEATPGPVKSIRVVEHPVSGHGEVVSEGVKKGG